MLVSEYVPKSFQDVRATIEELSSDVVGLPEKDPVIDLRIMGPLSARSDALVCVGVEYTEHLGAGEWRPAELRMILVEGGDPPLTELLLVVAEGGEGGEGREGGSAGHARSVLIGLSELVKSRVRSG